MKQFPAYPPKKETILPECSRTAKRVKSTASLPSLPVGLPETRWMPSVSSGSSWFYPFLALWSLLLGSFVTTLLIVGFAIVVERDEWCTKQCLYVVMFQIYWGLLNTIMSFLKSIPLAGFVFSIIDFIIWLVLLILVFAIGLGRLKNGKDSGLPGKGIVDRAYGMVQQYVQQPITPAAPSPTQQAVTPVIPSPVQQPITPVELSPMQQAVMPIAPSPILSPITQSPVQETANICTNCGAVVTGKAFCSQCGIPVNKG